LEALCPKDLPERQSARNRAAAKSPIALIALLGPPTSTKFVMPSAPPFVGTTFYELAKESYCVIQTGERRFYGCFVFKKGVIAPDAA
jgi:hypothetical protein